MGFLEENDFTDAPTIPEFYRGKTILVTGGSGFMGKVLIEKLLYSCSELDRIYVLLRTKKNVKPEERLDALYASECFTRLKNEKPKIFTEKVHVIAGDIMEIGLGLSQEDRTLLLNKVNVIFHVAASVRFDDPLTFATKLNLRGTREVVDLAKEVKDLNVFVHVSTSYTNTNRNPIDETMYPPHADWRETIHICETLDEETVRTMTPKFLGDIPNTYTFTKQLAEHVVNEQNGVIPAVMIRPSIVISSLSEPLVGWIENFNGPVGILVASGKGIMRSVYSDPDLIADYIPVDTAIRNIIAAGWVRGVKEMKPTDEMLIFNCCGANLNNMTMGEIMVAGKEIAKEQPLQSILWNTGGDITNSATLHFFKVIFFHLLPAILVDLVLKLIGRKPLLVKIQRRIYIANSALSYFTTHQWTFDNANFLQLRNVIKESDFDQFNYYIEHENKYDYFRRACAGARWFLLREKDEDLPKARAHYYRMYYLEKLVQVLLLAYLGWWVWKSSYFKSFAQFIL